MENEKEELKSKLMTDISGTLMRNDLEVETQLEVLTEAYADVVRFHATAILGKDGDEYLQKLLAKIYKVEIPLHGGKGAMECLGNQRSGRERNGGRVVMPDEANSWLRVFPSPLSAEQVLRAVLIHTDDDLLGYNPDHVARKMLGVLLTSLPEEDKKEMGERMKRLHLMQVKTPNHTRLKYVVFGAGMQASAKTAVIADRLAHQEIIEGIYFEDFLEVLDELEEMKAGYDADYEAQCEEDADDLPF